MISRPGHCGCGSGWELQKCSSWRLTLEIACARPNCAPPRRRGAWRRTWCSAFANRRTRGVLRSAKAPRNLSREYQLRPDTLRVSELPLDGSSRDHDGPCAEPPGRRDSRPVGRPRGGARARPVASGGPGESRRRRERGVAGRSLAAEGGRRRARTGGGGERSQVPLSRHDEPRDPHARQRHSRHGGPVAPGVVEPRECELRRNDPQLRRGADRAHRPEFSISPRSRRATSASSSRRSI